MISRNYTWIDDTVEHTEEDCARAAALAREWSEIRTNLEYQQFRIEGECWDECDEEEYEERKLIVEERDRQLQLKTEIIEEMLDRMGARMMRPYEHWNEDEMLMEYLENRD